MRADVRRLIAFVRNLTPESYHPDRIEVRMSDSVAIVEGFATTELVKIVLPTDIDEPKRYPRTHTHRKGAGAISYRCSCEEIVVTLAHEFRHVAQDRAPKEERPKHSEVDAEAFGRFARDLYRERRRCTHAPA